MVEDLAVKNQMWQTLDAVCGPETIFASNTSSLTIADMAAATKRPERMVGLHFFNPVPVMKLVEVVKTIATDPAVFDTAFAFAKSLGKEPIVCKDNSGFVVNLLLVPYMMDAIRALSEGVATIEDIDKGMQLGTGYPMGPFVLSRLRGAGYARQDRRHHVRRVQGKALRLAAAAQAHGFAGLLRPQERQGLLRLLRREAGPHAAGVN